jgi:two-component system nitrate/nitrite response regulator NarL
MSRTSPIRVLLCDDHHIVREGIRSSLSDYDSVEIVGEASDGQGALEKTTQLKPEVVLMDLNMPVMGGLEATRLLCQRFPDIKVIALTVHESPEYVSEILNCGARGYLLKNTSPQELVAAIRAVMEGNAFFSPSVARTMLEQVRTGKTEQVERLSKRELEVLRLIAQGATNKEIATSLDIGVRTVETHRARLMKKLNVKNAAALARTAFEQRLI